MAHRARAGALPLSRRSTGLFMMIGGVGIALAGIVGLLFSGGSGSQTASTTLAPTTTSPPLTTQQSISTTTTQLVPTTTLPPATTTTIDANAAIQTFVPTFAEAIAIQDVEYLLDTLHPSVFALFDEETCRSFITDEILQLEQYRLIGEADGPTTQLVAETEVDMYQAPVAFAFQGQEFTSEAAFAFVENQVRWFTQCGS